MNTNECKKEIEGEETLYDEYDDEIISFDSIRIDRDRMSLFEIKRRCERGDIILNPDFQRNEVWNKQKESELIESILMGIPIPAIYLFEDKYATIQVVDGRQRIATFIKFINNDFSLYKLKIMRDIIGKKFSNLELIQQRKIEDYQIDIYFIKSPTPEQIKFNIFDRVNRGGTQLNKQEMRNAMYQGQATQLLKKLSESENFKKVTGYSIDPKRMKDRYIILRFIGFYLYFSKQLKCIEYKGKIDDFLAKVMQFLNKDVDSVYVMKLNDLFDKIMEFAYEKFGVDIFRFSNNSRSSKRAINMALFESLSYAFALCVQNNAKIDKEELNTLKNEFDKSGKFTSGLDSVLNVKDRFDKVKELLK